MKTSYGTLLAVLSRVSDVVTFVAMTVTTNAITSTATNLHSFAVGRYARGVGFFAVAGLTAPSRQAIASAAFALASAAANLKRKNNAR